MTNKVKYPIEAFALAMVLFTADIKTAVCAAVALVVVDLVSSMLQGKLGKNGTSTVACAASAAVMYIVLSVVCGLEFGLTLIAGSIAIGVLMGKHYYYDEAEESIPAIVAAGVAMVAVGAIRMVLSGSSSVFMSSAYAKPMFGMIFAAIAIAIVNKIMKTNGTAQSGLWAGLATIVCAAPFVVDRFGEYAGSVAGMAVAAVIFYTFRGKLIFTNAEDTTKGLPVEMAMLGMIYMIMTIL